MIRSNGTFMPKNLNYQKKKVIIVIENVFRSEGTSEHSEGRSFQRIEAPFKPQYIFDNDVNFFRFLDKKSPFNLSL